MNNLLGQKFGHLTVIGLSPERKCACYGWVCRCICGTVKTVRSSHLTHSGVKSCGCQNNVKHGQHRVGKRSPEYQTWDGMIQRCTNSRHKQFCDYGGRGITVSAPWESFEQFYKDMGQKPTPKHTIERIDNNKGYEPANCRWATRSEQNLNKTYPKPKCDCNTSKCRTCYSRNWARKRRLHKLGIANPLL